MELRCTLVSSRILVILARLWDGLANKLAEQA